MPPRPSGSGNAIDRINQITESNSVAIVNFAVGRLDEPPPKAEGTGCVMAAGGKYLKYAYITVSRIRESGWTIPIQIWHLGHKEVSDRDRAKFLPLGVHFVDAHEVMTQHPMRRLGGWELKGYAVKHCRFRNVLLLDADSIPVRDPEPLFQSQEFKDTGAIFWPDIAKNRPSDNIFVFMGIKIPSGYVEAEAGQVMVDKVRNWKAVCLMNWMNSQSDFFYKHFHGDKETWPLAWMRLKQRYTLGPPCKWEDFGILHYWFDGEPVFEHHMTAKRDRDAYIPLRHHELLEEYAL